MSARELHVFYTPQPDEIVWAREAAGPDEHLLALVGKHSAHARAVLGSASFGGCYGESACAGGRQGLPSMRSCRTSMALRPCLRAVSM